MISKKTFALVVILVTLNCARADTPANCSYEDIRGVWRFLEGPRGQSKNINCNSETSFTSNYTVMLQFPDIAIDLDGNVGFWTIIYNQGFEVVINHRKYFAFSYFEKVGGNVVSECGMTFQNASHNTGVNPDNWSCFIGFKEDDSNSSNLRKSHKILESLKQETLNEKKLFRKNPKLIKAINQKQKSWTAKHYEFMSEMTINDLVRMAGGKKSKILSKPKPAKLSANIAAEIAQLPESFDWRNVNGLNYVSPVRNQGSCGSCYAFASMAMHESRLRIQSNNTEQNIFSPQDIVECTSYSQGCDGGFPYLIAGKYAEDFGLVEETCNPYKGVDGECSTTIGCRRYYATNYKYIGGFYGACNEALMRLSLVKRGPFVVAFEVYDDFFRYSGGIYHHTGLTDKVNFEFNPFELTNHAVTVVGFGADQATGEKYWIVKNSWSESWGEKGFFRIRRGTDECAIESIAVESEIIV